MRRDRLGSATRALCAWRHLSLGIAFSAPFAKLTRVGLASQEAGIAAFGHIDIVVVNAGIAEVGQFLDERTNKDGKPMVSTSNSSRGYKLLIQPCPVREQKPRMETAEVNIIGATYTVRLAFWALRRDETRPGRSIVIMLVCKREPAFLSVR